MLLLLFVAQLFFLFLLSRVLQKKLSLFFFRVTRNRNTTVYLLALLFFPGTLLHEIAHALMAHLLFVRVGRMELLPEIEGTNVKLGSVLIAKTDPVRRLLIGVAPFLVGTGVIVATLYTAEQLQLWNDTWYRILIIYTVFEVSNTMFSSKKDLEGALSLIIFFLIFASVSYLLGFRVSVDLLSTLLTPDLTRMLEQGIRFLLLPLLLDLLIISVLFLLEQLTKRF